MTIDDRSLNELIVESQDLQVDAMRDINATLPELAEIRHERRGQEIDLDEINRYNADRRTVLRNLGLGGGGMAARGLVGGGFGALLAGLLATPARADEALDIQILQTASSLEILAVATYGAALTLDFIKSGNPVVVKFAQTTMMQHDEHRKGFQAQTRALGGKEQTQPNAKFLPVVEQAKPTLKAPLDVVSLAETLETVATQTYLQNTVQLEDTASKKVMASVMGVESQHAAVLRAVKALLAADAADLIKIPIGSDAAKLPAAAGSVAFPEAFEPVTTVAEPASGAVK
ncbi:MAG: ferritin-like domain-containing protein [Acidimicrobiales bacterium]